MPTKVWIGRQLANYLLAFLASCQCQLAASPDAGLDAGTDAAIVDSGSDAGADAGPDTSVADAGPECPIAAGAWRFTGVGAPTSCGMFEFVATLATLADARGSRECTVGCSCVSTVPHEPACSMQWSETCGATNVQCSFHRVDDLHLAGRCDDGTCGVDWVAVPF